jgi:hypothetical protein
MIRRLFKLCKVEDNDEPHGDSATSLTAMTVLSGCSASISTPIRNSSETERQRSSRGTGRLSYSL